mgnify:CR=1 FL=1
MRKLKKSSSRTNETLNFLENHLFSRKERKKIKSITINTEKIHFKIPRVFSFIDNADETLTFIKGLFISRYKKNEIILDISECVKVSMCALFIFDYVLLMILYEKNAQKEKQNVWYDFSKDEKINKMFMEGGLSGYIKNDSKNFNEVRNNLSRIPLKLLKIKSGNKGKTNELIRYLLKFGKVDSIIQLEQNIKEFLDECLNEYGYHLNSAGERVIEKIISEWISNCKNHLKLFCEYYCTGSLNYEEGMGVCNLVLINFGETINESINSTDTTLIGKNTFEEITKKQVYDSKFTKENGTVLASIQRKVSRLKTETNTRGTGFPQIMEFFSHLSDDNQKSKMTIVSGNTQIKFAKSDYLRYNENGRIFFNNSNDPSKKPNSKNIIKLKNNFPGTLISIKFIFKKEHIEEI